MEKLYYMRNRGFCGNSWVWWKNGGGYTSNLNFARQFTKAELKLYLTRDEDTAYLVEDIDEGAERHFTGLAFVPPKPLSSPLT